MKTLTFDGLKKKRQKSFTTNSDFCFKYDKVTGKRKILFLKFFSFAAYTLDF